MERRFFLQSAAAYCLALQQNFSVAKSRFVSHEPLNPLDHYVSAAKDVTGSFSLEYFNTNGDVLRSFALPKRGHSFAMNDIGCLLAIGRRPADYFLAIDLILNRETLFIKASKNRRYYGHAAFNSSGELAYLTENNLDSGKGVIGVYDVRKQFKRINEFPSHGVGPHDISFDKQRQCLVVANGGIKTHPNTGRKKLNITTMQSSLTFIDPHDGSLIDKMVLDEGYRFNSIRHIALDFQSNVYVSLQNQKVNSKQVLLAIYRRATNTLEACEVPSKLESNLNRYLGDIALDQSQKFFAATSPRGNQVLIYKAHGEFLASYQMEDVCGVAKTSNANEFMVSSGNGKLELIRIEENLKLSINAIPITNFNSDLAWDNHLLLV